MKGKTMHKIIVITIISLLLSMMLSPTIYGSSYTNQNNISSTNQHQNNIYAQTNFNNYQIPMAKTTRNAAVYLKLPNIPITYTVQHTGPNSYFISTLSNVPLNYDVINGTYLGWCTDLDHSIQSNHPYQATLYNSYNTTLPSHLYHQNWSKVNYILNHKIGTNWWQVQYAIFYILDYGDEGLNVNGWAMVNNATLYGGNYTPGLDDVVAVIVDAGTSVQRTIIEVAIPEFTLSLSVVGNGTVNINPDQPVYLYGTIINLTASASAGWSFDTWSGDLNGSANPAQLLIDGNKEVTATFTQDQYLLTININGNGSVTRTPDQPTYTYGTVVTLTANPNTGWSFDMWTGDLNGSTNPEMIIMNANKTINATFTQDQYILNITINGSGQVIKDPDQTNYTYGTQVNLTATACPWWHFSHWSGDVNGTNTTVSIVMDEDKNVTAHFEIDQYILNITIEGNGTVIKEPDQATYQAGTQVNLTAIPDENWKFTEWTGDLSGSTNPVTVTMDSNKTIIAHFTNKFTIDITIQGSGMVLKNPNQEEYEHGAVVELTAVPNSGWEFDQWQGDVTGSDNPISIVIDGDKRITAVFIETSDTSPPQIKITKPENAIYVLDNRLLPFKFPLIIRGITIETEATDNDSGIDYVQFIIDDELVGNDTEAPYTYTWKDSKSIKIRHTVKVVAYDKAGNSDFDEICVFKWRFHPVLIALFVLVAFVIYRGDN